MLNELLRLISRDYFSCFQVEMGFDCLEMEKLSTEMTLMTLVLNRSLMVLEADVVVQVEVVVVQVDEVKVVLLEEAPLVVGDPLVIHRTDSPLGLSWYSGT
jgi:hypothetical protein